MDPDMVRQQEEAEAAARLRAAQPKLTIPPLAHVEPPASPTPPLFLEQVVAPPPAPPSQRTVKERKEHSAAVKSAPEAAPKPAVETPLIEEHITIFAPIEQPASPVRQAMTQAARIGGWSAALYCTALTGAGIAGGIMAGVKLQLVALQSIGIGATAGFAFGWLGAAGLLRRQGLAAGKAYRVTFLAAVLALLIELGALYFANGLAAAPPSGDPADANTIFAEIISAGGLLAYLFALIRIRFGVRRRAPADG